MAVSTAIALFIRILSSNTFDIVFALAIAVWICFTCVCVDIITDLKELVEYRDKLIKSYKEIIDSREELIDKTEELIRTYESILEKDDVIIEQLKALIHFKNKKQENNEDYHVQR